MEKVELYYTIPIFNPQDSIDIESLYNSLNVELKFIGEGSYAKVYKYKDPFYKKSFVVKRAKDNLNAKEIVITTPYSPLDFYRQCTTAIDRKIDTFEQLERRITSIEVTVDNLDQVKAQLLQFNSLQNAVEKIKKSNSTSPDKD